MGESKSILGGLRRRQTSQPPPASGPLVTTIALTDLLVGLLEYRDPFFRGGSSLTGLIAVAIGGKQGLDAERLQELALAALLRDIGRLVAGNQLISRSTTAPEPEERRTIERHVQLGLDLLQGIELPPRVRDAIRHHHERWDGNGYPARLAGEAIPIGARIIAVADSFAAMIRPRPYRTPLRVSAAVEDLQREAGRRYDPAIVRALVELLESPERPIFGISPGHHVLVVHEDELRATVVSAWLCQHGFLADIAAPEQTSDRIEHVPVAAIVFQGEPSTWHPAAFIRDLRSLPRAASLPLIAFDVRTELARAALLDAGADGCLTTDATLIDLRAQLALLVKRADLGWSEPFAAAGVQPQPPWHALHGAISDFPLPWLLQVLKYDSRSAAIVVETADDRGTVYIADGDPVHALTRASRGTEALREMLRWNEGEFSVRLDGATDERTIDGDLMHLLLSDAVAVDHQQFFGTVTGA